MFPFAVGATTGLFAERPTPETLSAAIERYRPTVVTNVPTMMGKLLDHDDALRAAGEEPLELGSVRFHLSAGEALPRRRCSSASRSASRPTSTTASAPPRCSTSTARIALAT